MVKNEIIIAPKDQPSILYLILTNAMHLCRAFSQVTSKGLTYLFIFSTDKHTHTHTHIQKKKSKIAIIRLWSLPNSGFLEDWIIFYQICNTIARRFYVRFCSKHNLVPRVLSYLSPTLRSKRDAPEKNQNRTLESRLQQTKANREFT